MHRRSRALAASTLALLGGMTLSACSSSTSSAPEDFTMTTAKPTITLVDTGETGGSLGDYQVFYAAGTKDGEPFGTLYGLKLEVALPGTAGAAADLGLFQNQLTFVLPEGTIEVAGVQYYTADGSIPTGSLTEGETRAIVGGTGIYAGAHGTLHTTASPDGVRTQEFDFMP